MGQMTCFNVREELRYSMKNYKRSVSLIGRCLHVWRVTDCLEFIEVVW